MEVQDGGTGRWYGMLVWDDGMGRWSGKVVWTDGMKWWYGKWCGIMLRGVGMEKVV